MGDRPGSIVARCWPAVRRRCCHGQRAEAQSASPGSSITVATVGDPGSLDPMPFTADLVSEIDQHIHETLYIFDPSLHFFPGAGGRVAGDFRGRQAIHHQAANRRAVP